MFSTLSRLIDRILDAPPPRLCCHGEAPTPPPSQEVHWGRLR